MHVRQVTLPQRADAGVGIDEFKNHFLTCLAFDHRGHDAIHADGLCIGKVQVNAPFHAGLSRRKCTFYIFQQFVRCSQNFMCAVTAHLCTADKKQVFSSIVDIRESKPAIEYQHGRVKIVQQPVRTHSRDCPGRPGKVVPAGADRLLQTVVHIKFDRMCSHPETGYLVHLQLDITINQVVRKNSTGRQEVPILVQGLKGLVQR